MQQGANPPQARGGCVPAGLDRSVAGPRGSEHAAQALCPEKWPCIVGRKGQRSHRPGLRRPWAPGGHRPGLQGRGAGFQGVFLPQALCGVRPWVAQSQPTCLPQAASPPGPEQVQIQGRWAGPGRPRGGRQWWRRGRPGLPPAPKAQSCRGPGGLWSTQRWDPLLWEAAPSRGSGGKTQPLQTKGDRPAWGLAPSAQHPAPPGEGVDRHDPAPRGSQMEP